jgi:ketosteroid isomerase-like protein
MFRTLAVIVACGSLCSVASAQTAATANLQETLFGIEQALCAAVQNKDVKTFAEHVAPDAVIAEGGRLHEAHKAGYAAHVEGVKIESFRLTDPKVFPISDTVAILSFNAEANATQGGKKLPAKNHVSTTFAKRDGKWLAVYTTSYPLD